MLSPHVEMHGRTSSLVSKIVAGSGKKVIFQDPESARLSGDYAQPVVAPVPEERGAGELSW